MSAQPQEVTEAEAREFLIALRDAPATMPRVRDIAAWLLGYLQGAESAPASYRREVTAGEPAESTHRSAPAGPDPWKAVPVAKRRQARKCGATRSTDGMPCEGWAVRGATVCQAHGGSAPQVKAKAAGNIAEQKAMRAVATFGLRRDISATDALIEEVQWTAGHVEWLREQVQALETEALTWGVTEESEKNATEFAGTDITRSAAVNAWVKLYQDERKHLIDVCRETIKAGVEERRVKLAERQGALLNEVIRRIFARLNLSPEQQALLPVVVPDELRRAAVAALN